MTKYRATKAEYETYTKVEKKAEQAAGGKHEQESVRKKLQRKQEKAEKQENRNKRHRLQRNDAVL